MKAIDNEYGKIIVVPVTALQLLAFDWFVQIAGPIKLAACITAM